MSKWFILLATLATTARADIIKLTDLSIEATQYIHGRSSLLEQPYEQKYGLNLNMGLRVSRIDYTRLRVTSATDHNQFRYVALEAESGLHLGQFDLYIRHHSQHMLDAQYTDGFRDDNEIGIRIKLYKEE